MGMTFQSFDLLKKNIEEFGKLGDVLTLGRLGNQIDKKSLKLLGLENNNSFAQEYSERILIDYLGANSVDSLDNSNFEGANIICDMSEELKNVNKQYDTIIDIGTSEHVFNINQNLINISKLCKKGGRIILNRDDSFYAYHKNFAFKKKLNVIKLGRGSAWMDVGNFSDLQSTSNFIQNIEHRQNYKIGCIEEVAYKMGFIDADQLHEIAVPLQKSGYGNYLIKLVDGN